MNRTYPERTDRVLSFLKTFVSEFRSKNVAFMAGSIAYSAFVSVLPLLLLALLIAAAIGGDVLVDYVVAFTQEYLTPAGQETLIQSVREATQRTELSILSVVVLLWAILRVFRGLDIAFSLLYGSGSRGGIVDQVRDGLVVGFAIVAAVSLLVGATAVVALFPQVPFLGLLSPLLLIAALTVAFLPIYYVFPDVDVSLRDVLPGTVVAAVGWVALQILFQLYVAVSGRGQLYGVLGGVLLLITWFYFGALVLLIGATTNVVLSRRLPATQRAGRDAEELAVGDAKRPPGSDSDGSTPEG